MWEMLVSIEKLPEVPTLFMLGAALLIFGVLVRKAVGVYERVIARKDVPELKGSRAEARP